MSFKILHPVKLTITVSAGTGTATFNENGVVLQTSVNAPTGAIYDFVCTNSDDTFVSKKSVSGDVVDNDPWVVVANAGDVTFTIQNANDGAYVVWLYIDRHSVVGR